MKYILPLLFIAYLGGITLFTHSHVVNGVIIVLFPILSRACLCILEVQLETIFFLASFVSSSLPPFPVAATVLLVLLRVLCYACHGMHLVCKASWRHLFACSPFFFSYPID